MQKSLSPTPTVEKLITDLLNLTSTDKQIYPLAVLVERHMATASFFTIMQSKYDQLRPLVSNQPKHHTEAGKAAKEVNPASTPLQSNRSEVNGD